MKGPHIMGSAGRNWHGLLTARPARTYNKLALLIVGSLEGGLYEDQTPILIIKAPILP